MNESNYIFPPQCYECSSKNVVIENNELNCVDCGGIFTHGNKY